MESKKTDGNLKKTDGTGNMIIPERPRGAPHASKSYPPRVAEINKRRNTAPLTAHALSGADNSAPVRGTNLVLNENDIEKNVKSTLFYRNDTERTLINVILEL
jgi:hypothetical protein